MYVAVRISSGICFIACSMQFRDGILCMKCAHVLCLFLLLLLLLMYLVIKLSLYSYLDLNICIVNHCVCFHILYYTMYAFFPLAFDVFIELSFRVVEFFALETHFYLELL